MRFPQQILQTVTTNVPGPRIPLYMLGRPLVEMFPYVPVASTIRITVGIFSFYIAGSANEAAALGVILIVVAAISVGVINRVAGARMGGMFG